MLFTNRLGFLIFLICAFAETNRTPFDLPESDSELIGGYHTEYSSMKLGFYLFAEYINMFISSAIISTLYFGGYHMPFIGQAWLSPNVCGYFGRCIPLCQNIFLHILLYVGTLDVAPFPL